MAAGLGFKTFATGDVLTAADTNGYLMQGVWVFADAAARDAAVTSPQEGNFAYLKDTNTTTYYTGSAWTNLDTTGMVNPMTTTGDTIYSSSGSTPARLGIGSTGQVLTVAGGVPSWATPASGGAYTLLSTTTLSGTSTTVSSISGAYTDLMVIINNPYVNTATYLNIRPNANNSISAWSGTQGAAAQADSELNSHTSNLLPTTSTPGTSFCLFIRQYANTTYGKPFNFHGGNVNGNFQKVVAGRIDTTSAITSIAFHTGNGTSTWSGGQVLVYGVK